MPGGQPIALELQPVADKEGTVEATFAVEESGPYLVRIVPATTDGDLGALRPATLDFRVDPRSQELDKPAIDRALLDDVARAGGGQLFTLGRLPADRRQFQDQACRAGVGISRRAVGCAAAVQLAVGLFDGGMDFEKTEPDGVGGGGDEVAYS